MYDHYTPAETNHPDGTFRVVGTSEEAVVLLRVGDADGRRVNTGEIVTVDYDDVERFEPAENPDGNRSLGATAKSQMEMFYWSLRVFLQNLIAHPLMTLVAVAVVLVGNYGEAVVQLPDSAYGILIIIGALGLAYIGSGRL